VFAVLHMYLQNNYLSKETGNWTITVFVSSCLKSRKSNARLPTAWWTF